MPARAGGPERPGADRAGSAAGAGWKHGGERGQSLAGPGNGRLPRAGAGQCRAGGGDDVASNPEQGKDSSQARARAQTLPPGGTATMNDRDGRRPTNTEAGAVAEAGPGMNDNGCGRRTAPAPVSMGNAPRRTLRPRRTGT